MVFYFTGTGNSRFIAEKIAAALNEPLFSINHVVKHHLRDAVPANSSVILVTPTYAWQIPHLVQEWLLQTELTGAEKIWFVMDCGSEIGNAAKTNQMLADRKKLQYMGTAQIIMPENYLAMFSTPSAGEAKAIIEAAGPVIEAAVEVIRAGREFPVPRNNLYDRLMSGPVNRVFYGFFVKADAFRVSDTCIGCGKCAQLCPLNNIHLEKQRPVWGKDCTHCMACISYCPAEAIEYGKHSVGLRRYHI